MIDRDYDPSLPSGAFDRNEIIQALLNVARNALQAVDPAGGRVTLRTRVLTNINIGTVRHRLVANIQIEDNGHGVPPELYRQRVLSAGDRAALTAPAWGWQWRRIW